MRTSKRRGSPTRFVPRLPTPFTFTFPKTNAAAAVEDKRPRVIQLPRLAAHTSPAIERLAVERELLHAVVAVFAHIHMSFAVERQTIRIVQLSRIAPRSAPQFDQLALPVEY